MAGVEREDQSLVSCRPRQHLHCAIQWFRVNTIFLMFIKAKSLQKVVVDHGWIYLFKYTIKEQYSEILLQFYRAVFCFNIFKMYLFL